MVDLELCVICGDNMTDNPDGICDDCKLSILLNKDVPPDIEDLF